jgi:hypothetical protein
MDPLTIILVTVAAGALIALAWMSGYELGTSAGVSAERDLANRRVRGVLEYENNRRPKSAKNKRKAARRASK